MKNVKFKPLANKQISNKTKGAQMIFDSVNAIKNSSRFKKNESQAIQSKNQLIPNKNEFVYKKNGAEYYFSNEEKITVL